MGRPTFMTAPPTLGAKFAPKTGHPGGRALGAADGGFDGAVGFVGGDEDVVGVFLAETA
jgi:hypothetical protein